ncbi:MAG: xanthine dehydrogenase family protein molybdopterin-binding subunit [Dinoroseobacter sp.]|nr:xanthine dehydrogenase family protein molybdopterin-binding subunit [Dinoroseobacter sp.]
MDKFGLSQPAKRVEDQRLLTGQGRYIADTAPDGALVGVVLRSPVAHGEITLLDVADADEMPGVALVLTAERLAAEGVNLGMFGVRVPNRDGSKGAGPERPLLARERVRFVGEPVAMVFAESRAQAMDAAELISLEINDLEVKVDPVPGGADLHAGVAENVAYDWGHGDPDAVEAALEDAEHVVRLRVEDNRIIANSLEPRGCWAAPEGDRLHLSVSAQGVWPIKSQLCRHLGLDEDAVRVTTPDVGGGFGMKSMGYPEYFVTAQAARMLGRACLWVSERTEAMLSDNSGRDLVSDVTLGFDADLRLIAFGADVLNNLGAYNSQFAQAIQTNLALKVLTGVYDVGLAHMRVRGIYTNTTQVDAYRGAGRPEAIYTLERAMDYAARELGVDPWELRRRNFIRPDQMPYKAPSGETYDVGEFARVMDRAADEAGLAGFPERRAKSAALGKLRGMGLCYYIEAILGDPSEGAQLLFRDDGMVELRVGTQSNGQGHETVYKQILWESAGIDPDRVVIVQGDSDLIKQGGGTGGSRSVTVQGTATRAVIDTTVAAFAPFVAEELGVDAADLRFEDGAFRAGNTNRFLSMLDAADMLRAAGQMTLLHQSARITLEDRSFPNGAHVAEIEIDPETGVLTVERYTAVDDFGLLMNPLLAEGQVHGGVAQGIGQAVSEHVVYDQTGQLLTASFMDYAMPRADSLPMVAFYSEPVPSKNNIFGMKGCGEAGTIGALAAVANAVQDAVWDLGIRQVDMPFTPHRLWEMLQKAA